MLKRLPDWLRKRLAPGHEAARTDALLKELGLNTICESGRCPNRDECYADRTATFMILGNVCTRSCGFCSVPAGKPDVPEADEPARVASAVRRLGLKHVVVTSVNRDDMQDEGAAHFARVIGALRALPEEVIVELLTPDFKRTQQAAVETVLEAGPHIFGHNIETVPRLYASVRPQARYESSLSIFGRVRKLSGPVRTKSGLMLGLGEKPAEVLSVMRDLIGAGCQMLTLGQYLRSDPQGLKVEEFVTSEQFQQYRFAALDAGFDRVESAPFVRSSYHAKGSFESLIKDPEEQHARS